MSFQVLAAEFAEEALDLLLEIEATLLDHERQAGDPAEQLRSIRRHLHTLKGNAGLVGASTLQAVFHQMEDMALQLGEDAFVGEALLRTIDEVRSNLRRILDGGGLEASPSLQKLATEGVTPISADALHGRGDGSLRIDPARIDQLTAAAGELLIQNARMQKLLTSPSREQRDAADAMDASVQALHRMVLALRTLPVGPFLSRYRRMVRDEARGHEKDVDLRVVGDEVEIDKRVLDTLGEVLGHLIRNAVVHGIETPAERESQGKPPRGTVSVEVTSFGSFAKIEVADDGKGLDEWAILARARALGLDATQGAEALIFEPGISTASLSQSAGRGVGLDAVQRAVAQLGGAVTLTSAPGEGTRFTLEVPTSVALERALLCQVGDEVFALPTSHVVEAARVEDREVRWLGKGSAVESGGKLFPLVDTATLLGVEGGGRTIVFLRAGTVAALQVDALLGQQDFIFHPLDPALTAKAPVDSAALLADGSIVLRLDPLHLVQATAEQEVRP
jgi:two-component system chemotaxis sensor kinase CheA